MDAGVHPDVSQVYQQVDHHEHHTIEEHQCLHDQEIALLEGRTRAVPSPETAKACSTATDALRRKPKRTPEMVRTGRTAFRRAWWRTTMVSRTPLARAVQM